MGCSPSPKNRGEFRARNVCLALGRRGTPNKLNVPGEERSKVAYSLLDAQSFRDRHVLVVGGGDSAVEAALGLAKTSGNRVTISYRREAFFHLKARNESRLRDALESGRMTALLSSEVLEIGERRVRSRHAQRRQRASRAHRERRRARAGRRHAALPTAREERDLVRSCLAQEGRAQSPMRAPASRKRCWWRSDSRWQSAPGS